MPTEINVIKHDNLNRRSYVVDKKHLNKAAGVPQLAKNIKYSINNTFRCIQRNTSFHRKNKYGDIRPRARGPADNSHSKPADMNFSVKHVSQSAENFGHNSSSEVSTCLSEVMKQLQLMNNNF